MSKHMSGLLSIRGQHTWQNLPMPRCLERITIAGKKSCTIKKINHVFVDMFMDVFVDMFMDVFIDMSICVLANMFIDVFGGHVCRHACP